MIKQISILLLACLISAKVSEETPKFYLQNNEVLVKYISDFFETPQKREELGPLPYTVSNVDDPKAVRYTEWNEAAIGYLNSVSDCKNAEVVSSNKKGDSVFTALCSDSTLATFTVGNGVDENEKKIKSIKKQSVTTGTVAETYSTVGFPTKAYVTAGYSADKKTISLNIFKKDAPTTPILHSYTPPVEFNLPLGLTSVLAFPPPTPPTPSLSTINGLRQSPVKGREILITFETTGANKDIETNSIALTNILEDKIETKILKLSIENNFIIDNPKIINIEGINDRLLITYTSRAADYGIRFAQCQVEIDENPTGSLIIIEAGTCSDLNTIPNQPKNPTFVFNKVNSGTGVGTNRVAIFGEPVNDKGIELVICEYDLAKHVASKCKSNSSPVNPRPNSWSLEYLQFNSDPQYSVNIAFGVTADPGVPRAYLQGITTKTTGDGFDYEIIYDGRVTAFVYLHSRLSILLRKISYSLYNVDFNKGVIIADTSRLPVGKSIPIIQQKGGGSVTIDIEVLADLKTDSKFDASKVPNFSLYEDETIILPLERRNFIGNALTFDFESSDKDAGEFGPLNTLKVKFELAEFEDSLVTLRLTDAKRGYALVKEGESILASYYVDCQDRIDESGTTLVCQADKTTNLRHERTAKLHSVYAVEDPATPGVVAVIQSKSAAGSSFISYNQNKEEGKRQKVFKADQNPTQAEGFFFFQTPGGVARLMIAYPNLKKIVYYEATKLEFEDIDTEKSVIIDNTFPGLENDVPFCPKYINVCSHSNSFFEVGSVCEGDARIFKWSLDFVKDQIEPRSSVSLSALELAGAGKDITFCPSGDEFTAYGSGKLYGTKTKVTQASFNLGLDQFGFNKLDGYACLRKVSSYAATGLNKDGDKRLLATFFGNTGEDARSRIHSVVEIETEAKVTSSSAPGVVNHFIQIPGEKSYFYRIYLAGPLVHYTAKKTDNTDVLIKYGPKDEDLIEEVYSGIKIDEFEGDIDIQTATTKEIQKGFNRFEDSATINGHIWNASLNVKKEELKDKIRFVPRVEVVADPQPEPEQKFRKEIMRRLLKSKESSSEQSRATNEDEGKLLGFEVVGPNLMSASVKDGKTKVRLHRGYTAAVQSDYDDDRIYDYFVTARIDEGSLTVLGSFDGVMYQIRAVFFPDDNVLDYVSTDLIKTTKIDGLVLEKQSGNEAVLGLWTKYYNTFSLHTVKATKDEKGTWSLSPQLNAYPVITGVNGFREFARVSPTTIAAVYGDYNPDYLDIQIIGGTQGVQRLLLQNTAAIKQLECTPKIDQSVTLNSCTAANLGNRNSHFDLSIDEASGEGTVNKLRTFLNYKGFAMHDFVVSNEYTIFHGVGMEKSALLVYNHSNDKWLHWGINSSEYSSDSKLTPAFQIYKNSEGKDEIVIIDQREATSKSSNQILFKKFLNQDWGVFVEEEFKEADAIDASLSFIDNSGKETKSEDIIQFFDPDYVPPKPDPKPDPKKEGKSFFKKYWWIFLILVILIAIAVGFFIFQKQKEASGSISDYNQEMVKDDN